MRNKLRRPLAFLLSAVMIVTMSGTPVHAVADRGQPETGLCEHHAAHTDDCGYTEETPGTPCGHEHTEDCYIEVTECVHEHTPECYPEETEDSVSGNEATPANAKEREPENCPHICDGESGCITEKLDCRHEHDSECGYTESTPGTPCTFVCEICNPQDSGEAGKESETGIIKQEQCSCLTLCTEGQINPDCPVCGGLGAGLSDCRGKTMEENPEQSEDTGICKHHQEHDDTCGYQPASEDEEGSPCTYDCRICPIEDLIAALPDKVTEDNVEEVREQLDKILDLYRELTGEEQEQIDISRCLELQETLDAANAPEPIDEPQEDSVAMLVKDGVTTYYNESDFANAFSAENSGATVTLLGNVELADYIQIDSGTFTLNLNGYMINNNTNKPAICLNGDGANLTICGSGNVRSNRNTVFLTAGTLTLEGGTFSSSGVNNQGAYVYGGTLNVSNASVTVDRLGVSSSANVSLTAGTYTGSPAIVLYGTTKTLANLLGTDGNYAYYGADNQPLVLEELGEWDDTAWGTVLPSTITVGECDHEGVPIKENGNGTHSMNCPYCGYSYSHKTTLTATASRNTVTLTGGCNEADCGYTAELGKASFTFPALTYGETGDVSVTWDNPAESYYVLLNTSMYQIDKKATEASIPLTKLFSDAPLSAGEHTLTVSFFSDASVFSNACDLTFSVAHIPLTADMVTLPGDRVTYSGTTWMPTPSVQHGENWLSIDTDYDVSYTRDGVTTTDFTSAGTITVTVTGKGNYAGTVTKVFTITPATPTVTWSSTSQKLTYTGNPAAIIAPTVTLVNNESFSGTIHYSYTGTTSGTGLPTNAGTYTIKAHVDAAGNYTAADSGEMTLTINKAPAPTITWPAANGLTYGQKLSESTLSGGSTEYGFFAWTNPDTVPTAGTSGYSVTFMPSDSTEQNYEPIATKTHDVNVTVAQTTPTVTVSVELEGNAGSRTANLTIIVTGAQNGAAPAGSITVTGDGLSETLTLQNGKATHKWENLSNKEYTVTAVYGGDTNYKAANGQLTFDAAKKNQEALVISPVEAKTYGDPAFTLATTGGNGSGAVSFTSSDPSIISINGSTAAIHKTGDVTITARKAADSNYNEAVAAISLTIGKRPITVTADSFTVAKGSAIPALTYQITSGSLAGTDSFITPPTLTVSAKDTDTVAEFDITISGGVLTNGDNYQITYVNGKLIVTDKIPVKLTMTANPASLTGGGTVTLTISGLPSGKEATVSCSDSSINVTGNGTSWKADLPNETATYTFTANYGGDAQHSSAVATCTVSVTKRTDSSGSTGGGGNSGGSSSGGDSSSGGGSSSGDNGSSGGGSTIVARPNETKPEIPTTSQTKPAAPDKNGNVVVDNGTVQSAINAAKNDAKKNGNTANGVAVVIPITPKEGQNSFNVTINAQTLNTLVREKVKRLEINIEGVVVGGMDTKLLKWLDTLSANGDVIFRVKQIDPSGLSKEAKAAIGTRPVYNLSLVYLSGGKETPITDFDGHTIAVRLPYAPAKDEKTGNLYAVYVDGKGKVEWLTKSSYDPDLGTVVFETGHFSIYGIGYKNPAPTFTDIKNHWAEDNIIFVVSRGLLTGTGNNQFSPDTGMTRGMFVTALGRLAGIAPADYKTGKFTDVKVDAYYAPYVNWAAEKGIVNGTTATTFSPDTNITREQMAVIMANYAKKLGYDLPVAHDAVTFADNAQISSWAAKEVKAMQQAGIMAGKGGNRFDPKGTATRAEVATVLRRFVEIVIDPQTAQGWMQNHSGSWQYMKNGKPATGWLQDDKKWYWLDNNGWMFAGGWKQIDGKWYYFHSDGSMAVNTTIDGYAIGPNGARK